MPRHPPYALNNLTNTQNKQSTKPDPTPEGNGSDKMLASTVQFSTNKQPPPRRPHHAPTNVGRSETRDGPARRSTRPHPGPGSAPSGPNSVPTKPHPRQPAF